MNLIIIYGPPAAGKLTIAKELEKAIKYKLLDNHSIINSIGNIFSFEDPIRRKLTREFRIRIIQEAIKQNINLIITLGTAGSTSQFDHFDEIISLIEKNREKIFLVQLIADKEALLSRVENDSRKKHGKTLGKHELNELLNKHENMFYKYPNKEHLTINTHKNLPKESAQKIINYYNLV